MRLLYVIEKISTKGGLERILIDKMNALAELPGYEVFLMTVWNDAKEPAFKLSDKIHTICLSVNQRLYPLSLITASRRFNKQVKDIAPDIAIQFRAVGSFLILFSSWRGCTILESHTARTQSNHRWLLSLIENKVNAIVCLTQGNAREFSNARKVAVIPNFTNLPATDTLPDYNSHHCICVGRFHPIKNHSRLIDIWKTINTSHPDWTLDLYGDGELRQAIEQKINRLNLSRSIIIHGNTNDIQKAYLQSSILIMTSISEGLPMTLIEAQQTGLPVVSFDCPFGPADIIHDGKNGYLIPYDDNAAMVTAICRLMDNTQLRSDMGANARQSVTRFNKDEVIQQWDKFFNDITK